MEKECENSEMTFGYRGGQGTSGTLSIYKTNWLNLSKKFDEYINLKYGNTPVMDTGSDFDVYMKVLDDLCKDEQNSKNWSLKEIFKRIRSTIKYRRFKKLACMLLFDRMIELKRLKDNENDIEVNEELSIRLKEDNELYMACFSL